MDITSDIAALDLLPESGGTALCGGRYFDRQYVPDIHIVVNVCYFTCDFTRVVEA